MIQINKFYIVSDLYDGFSVIYNDLGIVHFDSLRRIWDGRILDDCNLFFLLVKLPQVKKIGTDLQFCTFCRGTIAFSTVAIEHQ